MADQFPIVDPVENLMKLLQLVSSLMTNPVNQLNRIGGTDVPLYDPDLTWREVFQNAGYGERAAGVMGFAGDVVEPGPGEFKALAELLPVLGIIGKLPSDELARAGRVADQPMEAGRVVDEPMEAGRVFDEPMETVEMADLIDEYANQSIWHKLRHYASAREEDIRELYDAEGFESVRAALSGTDWWANMFPDEETAYRQLHRMLMPTIDVGYRTGGKF